MSGESSLRKVTSWHGNVTWRDLGEGTVVGGGFLPGPGCSLLAGDWLHSKQLGYNSHSVEERSPSKRPLRSQVTTLNP